MDRFWWYLPEFLSWRNVPSYFRIGERWKKSSRILKGFMPGSVWVAHFQVWWNFEREKKTIENPIQDPGNNELQDAAGSVFVSYCCMFVVGCIQLSMVSNICRFCIHVEDLSCDFLRTFLIKWLECKVPPSATWPFVFHLFPNQQP